MLVKKKLRENHKHDINRFSPCIKNQTKYTQHNIFCPEMKSGAKFNETGNFLTDAIGLIKLRTCNGEKHTSQQFTNTGAPIFLNI